MNRILLVDDDIELCGMLAEYLAPEGFDVASVHDGEQGAREAVSGRFDAVVLDVMLPLVNGIDALREIRTASRVPVIMLTAKGDDIDRIVGLELGADDYLPKPCNPRELVARLRAVLRRAGSHSATQGEAASHDLSAGGVTLRPGERAASWQGEPLELTSTEYNVLEALVRNAGRTVSKSELSELALGRPLERYDRSLDMHVSNLRRKLGDLPDGRSPIQTVRGLGYQLLRG